MTSETTSDGYPIVDRTAGENLTGWGTMLIMRHVPCGSGSGFHPGADVYHPEGHIFAERVAVRMESAIAMS